MSLRVAKKHKNKEVTAKINSTVGRQTLVHVGRQTLVHVGRQTLVHVGRQIHSPCT